MINDAMKTLENQVEDMHDILVNISYELKNIRSAIEANLQTTQKVSLPSSSLKNGEEEEKMLNADKRVLKKTQSSVRFQGIGSNHANDINGIPTSPEINNSNAIMDNGRKNSSIDDDRMLAIIGKAFSRPQYIKRGREFVTLNVGGKKHEVCWDTLDKFPNSRLGRLRKCMNRGGALDLCDDVSLSKGECYFDRSPRNFDAILGLYRTGKLHLSQGVCVQDFCDELEYWGLSDLHLEPCCQHTYYRARWLLPRSMKMEEEHEDVFGEGFMASMQKKLWNLFENPNSSLGAKMIAVLSCLFVVASTFSLIISTLPMFQSVDGRKNEEHFIFAVAEAIFVGWFSIEYLVRFIAAPEKWRFVKSAMNIIDLFGVLPYFMSLMLSIVAPKDVEMDNQNGSSSNYQDEMMRIAQIFRIMRILRIFKLARHITGLQTLGFTLRNSYKELGLLMLVVIMGMLIFSGLGYVSEKDVEGTAFVSMPQALYWAIITMTSVGYGDIYPTTWFGKLVGSSCAICGVLCISLPIPIIVNNFNKFYEKAKIEEQIEIKRKKVAWEEAKKDLLDARRKSCIAAAGEWKKLIKVNSSTSPFDNTATVIK